MGPVNVSSVPQRSPFRYPGGKTWLQPTLRKAFEKVEIFVEPFAGGASSSLLALCENKANFVVINELDPTIKVVWEVIFSEENEQLCDLIQNFEFNYNNVVEIVESTPKTSLELAFKTIIRNRANHGGKLSKGTGLIKSGDGKGIASRWYPETIAKRINNLYAHRSRVKVTGVDGLDCIKKYSNEPSCFFLVDPPYTASKKSPGRRLYDFSELDHDSLFDLMTKVNGDFIMTYDVDEEVSVLAEKYGFSVKQIPMTGTQNKIQKESIIGNDLSWLD